MVSWFAKLLICLFLLNQNRELEPVRIIEWGVWHYALNGQPYETASVFESQRSEERVPPSCPDKEKQARVREQYAHSVAMVDARMRSRLQRA
jgi:hypothetical protein